MSATAVAGAIDDALRGIDNRASSPSSSSSSPSSYMNSSNDTPQRTGRRSGQAVEHKPRAGRRVGDRAPPALAMGALIRESRGRLEMQRSPQQQAVTEEEEEREERPNEQLRSRADGQGAFSALRHFSLALLDSSMTDEWQSGAAGPVHRDAINTPRHASSIAALSPIADPQRRARHSGDSSQSERVQLSTADRQLFRESHEEALSLRKALLTASNAMHAAQQELRLERERAEEAQRERNRLARGLRELTLLIDQKDAEVSAELKQRARTESELRERIAATAAQIEGLENMNDTLGRDARELRAQNALLQGRIAELERDAGVARREAAVAKTVVARLQAQQKEVDEFHARHLKRFAAEAASFASHWQRVRAADTARARDALHEALVHTERQLRDDSDSDSDRSRSSTRRSRRRSSSGSDDDRDGKGATDCPSGDSLTSDGYSSGNARVPTSGRRHKEERRHHHHHQHTKHDPPPPEARSSRRKNKRPADGGAHNKPHPLHHDADVELSVLLARHDAAIERERRAATKHRRQLGRI